MVDGSDINEDVLHDIVERARAQGSLSLDEIGAIVQEADLTA